MIATHSRAVLPNLTSSRNSRSFIFIFSLKKVCTKNIDFKHYQEGVKNIQISNVDLNSIDDGTYEGYSDVGYIKAKVEVTVKDGKLTSIKLIEHLNERGSRAEAIIGHMLKEQRIDVDSITGATNSSLVIKDAVQKALSAK